MQIRRRRCRLVSIIFHISLSLSLVLFRKIHFHFGCRGTVVRHRWWFFFAWIYLLPNYFWQFCSVVNVSSWSISCYTEMWTALNAMRTAVHLLKMHNRISCVRRFYTAAAAAAFSAIDFSGNYFYKLQFQYCYRFQLNGSQQVGRQRMPALSHHRLYGFTLPMRVHGLSTPAKALLLNNTTMARLSVLSMRQSSRYYQSISSSKWRSLNSICHSSQSNALIVIFAEWIVCVDWKKNEAIVRNGWGMENEWGIPFWVPQFVAKYEAPRKTPIFSQSFFSHFSNFILTDLFLIEIDFWWNFVECRD